MKKAETGPYKWMHTDEELKDDFAAQDNSADNNRMYINCDDAEKEMDYEDKDIFMAKALKMLMTKPMIMQLHKQKHGNTSSPFDKEITTFKLRGDFIKKLVKENKKSYTIQLDSNKHSEKVYDVMLNEDFGVQWLIPNKNASLKTKYEWSKLVVQFYFPEQDILCNALMSTCL